MFHIEKEQQQNRTPKKGSCFVSGVDARVVTLLHQRLNGDVSRTHFVMDELGEFLPRSGD